MLFTSITTPSELKSWAASKSLRPRGWQEKNGLTPELVYLGPNGPAVSKSAKKGDPKVDIATLLRWEVLSEQASIQSARVLRVHRQRATRPKSQKPFHRAPWPPPTQVTNRPG